MRICPKNFPRALSLLNSLLILVFVLFMVEILDLSYLLKFGFIFIFLITGAMKVYFMSAVSGCLLEIMSTEHPILQIRKFNQHVKNFWLGFLIAFVLLRLADFILFVLFSSFPAWRDLCFRLLEAVTALVLAQWAINKKYIKPLGIPARQFQLKPGFLVVMFLACLVEFAFSKIFSFIPDKNFHWKGIWAFIINYIHVFEFIVPHVIENPWQRPKPSLHWPQRPAAAA